MGAFLLWQLNLGAFTGYGSQGYVSGLGFYAPAPPVVVTFRGGGVQSAFAGGGVQTAFTGGGVRPKMTGGGVD